MSGNTSCKALPIAALIATAIWLSAACAAAGAPTAVDANDTRFAQTAAAAGAAEVELGQLALQKSSDNAVKALAQRVIDDHTKADAELARLGQQKQMTLPAEPDAEAVKAYASLSGKSGKSFDQAWLTLVIKDHQKALKLFASEEAKGKDGDLRAFAATTVPTLQEHMKAAKQIAAVPKARDKAMDDTMKAMGTTDIGAPAPTSTAAVPATTPMPAASGVASPAVSSSAPAPAGQKH